MCQHQSIKFRSFFNTALTFFICFSSRDIFWLMTLNMNSPRVCKLSSFRKGSNAQFFWIYVWGSLIYFSILIIFSFQCEYNAGRSFSLPWFQIMSKWIILYLYESFQVQFCLKFWSFIRLISEKSRKVNSDVFHSPLFLTQKSTFLA